MLTSVAMRPTRGATAGKKRANTGSSWACAGKRDQIPASSFSAPERTSRPPSAVEGALGDVFVTSPSAHLPAPRPASEPSSASSMCPSAASTVGLACRVSAESATGPVPAADCCPGSGCCVVWFIPDTAPSSSTTRMAVMAGRYNAKRCPCTSQRSGRQLRVPARAACLLCRRLQPASSCQWDHA